MYENVTYEEILERMLSRVPNNMDKREGAIIYDALAPAAVELQLMYIELDVILKETFADTASREYLIRRVKERGIVPENATKAVLKGSFRPENLELQEGTRFSCGTLNYQVTEKISAGEYKLECETEGSAGNGKFGKIIPINYIEDLEYAELNELLIPGEDEEDTESLRSRYFNSFASKAFGGNKKDYMDKTKSIPGVGAVKVNPVWDGGGTVKLTVLDSQYNKASDVLLGKVQQEIDPQGNGLGTGLAPIGHVVTVETAEEAQINVAVGIIYDTGYSFEILKSQIFQAVEEYLKELRSAWEEQPEIIVRIAQIESRLLSIEGILDISNTALNGAAENIVLSSNHIPVLGGVTA